MIARTLAYIRGKTYLERSIPEKEGGNQGKGKIEAHTESVGQDAWYKGRKQLANILDF
jgi:hypothetical protein